MVASTGPVLGSIFLNAILGDLKQVLTIEDSPCMRGNVDLRDQRSSKIWNSRMWASADDARMFRRMRDVVTGATRSMRL